jgi:hypothetical protein
VRVGGGGNDEVGFGGWVGQSSEVGRPCPRVGGADTDVALGSEIAVSSALSEWLCRGLAGVVRL